MPTHEVRNQVPPITPFEVSRDPALLSGLTREGAGWAEAEVRELGVLAGSEKVQEWGRLANDYPPVLRTHDRYGNHIDEVEFHPHWHDLMTLAVEHGLHGTPWADHRPGAQPDVHSLAWHPREPGRAYEAGGGGAAWSDDAGDTWHPADDGRDRHYTWSVAVDPADPDLWYVSASRGPYAAHGRGDPQAGVYRRRNGSWDVLAGGLPDPLPAMPYALVADGERLFAGLANGELWETRDRGDTWSRCELLGEKLTRLVALAAA